MSVSRERHQTIKRYLKNIGMRDEVIRKVPKNLYFKSEVDEWILKTYKKGLVGITW